MQRQALISTIGQLSAQLDKERVSWCIPSDQINSIVVHLLKKGTEAPRYLILVFTLHNILKPQLVLNCSSQNTSFSNDLLPSLLHIKVRALQLLIHSLPDSGFPISNLHIYWHRAAMYSHLMFCRAYVMVAEQGKNSTFLDSSWCAAALFVAATTACEYCSTS